MDFIGVIGKNKILKDIISKHVNIIKINNKNVDNIKNVKFQIIVINDNLIQFLENTQALKSIINNAEYIIINSDLKIEIDIFNNINKKIITCGLNQKATITISSISQESILIYLQREIENLNKKIIEPGEMLINLRNKSNIQIHEILINYALSILYNEKIMSVI